VGDVDCSSVELFDDVAHRREHLDLGGHIKGGGRFVEYDQVGTRRHRHGRHHPLQLAPGHLVRIAAADGLGIGQLQSPEQLDRVGA
jgi:hypothetical protein